MKFVVTVDCTPEEARSFLGLPDLKPIQDKVLHEIEEQLLTGVRAMSPEQMLGMWMPGSANVEQLQAFFTRMTGFGGNR